MDEQQQAASGATIRGRVREETTGAPVESAWVTDGHSFACTNADGEFAITTHAAARWISLINPPGFAPRDDLFRMLPDDRQTMEPVDFSLRRLANQPCQSFSFIHCSDRHVANPYRAKRMEVEIACAIRRMPDPPAFVLDTGDMGINNTEQLKLAAELKQSVGIPYMSVIGNHDRPFRNTYESLYHPTYHAFTCGNYLFIALPWGEEAVVALEWARQVLEIYAATCHVIVGVHHLEGLKHCESAYYELFKQYNVRGIFCGHYHTNHVRAVQGIPVYLTRGAVARNSDCGLPVFNVVTAQAEGALEIEQRQTNGYRHAEVVCPGNRREFVTGTRQDVVVRAYDTAVKVARITGWIYGIEPDGPLLETFRFEQDTPYLWSAPVQPQSNWPREVYLMVASEGQDGACWPILQEKCAVQLDPCSSAAKTSSNPVPPKQSSTRGRIEWVARLNAHFSHGAVTVEDDQLFLGCSHYASTRHTHPVLVALSGSTGQQRWVYHEPACSVGTTPLVTADRVVFLAADGRVVCLDKESGQRIWENDVLVAGGLGTQVYLRSSPMRLDDDGVLVGMGHHFARLSLRDGSAVWYPHAVDSRRGPPSPSPVVHEGNAYLADAKLLRCINPATGEARWEFACQGVNARPVLNVHSLFAVLRPGHDHSAWDTSRWENHAVCLDAETGTVRWDRKLKHRGLFMSAPLFHEGAMVVMDYDDVVALHHRTGEVLWRESLSGVFSADDYLVTAEAESAARYLDTREPVVYGDPCLVNGRAYWASRLGTVVCFCLRSRCRIWDYALNTVVLAGPRWANDRLYVAGQDGGVYAFTCG